MEFSEATPHDPKQEYQQAAVVGTSPRNHHLVGELAARTHHRETDTNRAVASPAKAAHPTHGERRSSAQGKGKAGAFSVPPQKSLNRESPRFTVLGFVPFASCAAFFFTQF